MGVEYMGKQKNLAF